MREVARCRFFGRNLFPREQDGEGGEPICRGHSYPKGDLEQVDVRRHQEPVESVYPKAPRAVIVRLPSQLPHCRGEVSIRIKPLWDWGEGGGYWVGVCEDPLRIISCKFGMAFRICMKIIYFGCIQIVI